MNRLQLQQLAAERLLDAEALLNAGRWSGAYYLAGYAVECALKACIAKLTNQHDFPDKDLATKAFTHKIEDLVRLANLETLRDADRTANAVRRTNWTTIRVWDEKSRYQQWTEIRARTLFKAVSDAKDGVLPWIMGHW